ncbi:hypothetical protein BDY21DRAFT_50455 [Lineolata rhizophorae]|uniref:Uncharacterized protein n=1 Tax=Lineolata rhizophorae TaxID=578093 RepID=A0A6A6NXF1_9PEZI|nr:hypothetical protein BDY21DRAFT_50455 [Lineolata rhizophorae]
MVGLELEEKGNHLDASNGHEGESSLQDPSQNIEAAANNDMLQHIGDVTTQGRHKSFSWQSILDENSRLREERNKAREVLQDTQSKLRDSHERLEKLQTEALSSVDRFQPAFDEHIVSRFNDLVQTMKPIGSYLANQKQQIDPRRWGTAVLEYLRVDAINKAAPRFNYDEKSIRKKVLKAVTWQFLENTVFGDPFLCFGTEVAHQAREMYHVFYEDPCRYTSFSVW